MRSPKPWVLLGTAILLSLAPGCASEPEPGPGGADGGVVCTVPADCPGSDGACSRRTCENQRCGTAYFADGTAVASDYQQAGDCRRLLCDGAGATRSIADDTDLPEDDNPCTQGVCSQGVASHSDLAEGLGCGVGLTCDGHGRCVGCTSPATCPGQDDECQARTCVANACGLSFVPADTPLATQNPGDCRSRQCDGAGKLVEVADNEDAPVDGNECTEDRCVDGTPDNQELLAGTECSQAGGKVCDGHGACVECLGADSCPGEDGDCAFRTCVAGACAISLVPVDTELDSQTPGDCRVSVCDGEGSVVVVDADEDLPDDGNPCTADACADGAASHAAAMIGTPCGDALFCDADGHCIGCSVDADCQGGPECRRPICDSGQCGSVAVFDGERCDDGDPATAGDSCVAGECVGAAIGCLVAADCQGGSECLRPTCDSGQCRSVAVVDGEPCDDGDPATAGDSCVAGECVGAVPAPKVASTSPADGAWAPASTAVSVSFDQAMSPATLVAQPALGACTGSIQVSVNDFATCVGLTAMAMSNGNKTVTFTPEPGLLVNRVYRILVTTSATSSSGVPLASPHVMTTGFMTTDPRAVVISQIYGGGGTASGAYEYDFVVLHNRTGAPASLAGWSLQHASATGGTWTAAALSSGASAETTIAPGGHLLVQLGSAGTAGAKLPAPVDLVPTTALNLGASGKIALVRTTTALSGACPTSPAMVDLVGWGTANCAEPAGGSAVASLGADTAAVRKLSGCLDTDTNSGDFAVAAAAPVNSTASAVVCPPTANETGAEKEIKYCTTQWPLSLDGVPAGSSQTLYAQLWDDRYASNAPAMTVQFGYGPASKNPQYQAGWSWTGAPWHSQQSGNEQYSVTLAAPAAGSYAYAFRVSLDGGASWSWCDNRQGDAGAGSNPGLAFDLENLGVLTTQ